MTAKEYQKLTRDKFRHKFPELEVISEWAAFNGIMNQYSPRVDIAVGPFNINPGPNLLQRYNELVRRESVSDFLSRAFEMHIQNLSPLIYHEISHPPFDLLIDKNQNSRCLFAIEIENLNSKKHIMGSIINAASLGRVGIGIAYCQSAFSTFLRILNYLSFLKRVEKNYYDTTNFLVLSVQQFDSLMG